MSGPSASPNLPKGAGRVLALAVVPFLASIFLLGLSLQSGLMREFAIGWPLFQIFGYAITWNMTKGDVTQAVFKAQVAIHWVMLGLLVAVIVRAT